MLDIFSLQSRLFYRLRQKSRLVWSYFSLSCVHYEMSQLFVFFQDDFRTRATDCLLRPSSSASSSSASQAQPRIKPKSQKTSTPGLNVLKPVFFVTDGWADEARVFLSGSTSVVNTLAYFDMCICYQAFQSRCNIGGQGWKPTREDIRRDQRYKTFCCRKLRLSQTVCPWQAFPASFNVSR